MKQILKSAPFIGIFFRWINSILRTNNTRYTAFSNKKNIERLNNKIEELELLLNKQDEYYKKLFFSISDKLEALYSELEVENKMDISYIMDLYQKLIDEQNKIDKLILKVENNILSKEIKQSLKSQETEKFSLLYKAFEDRFRGTKKQIKNDLEPYLGFTKILSSNNKSTEILDIGCGRGEWLELLSSKGFKAKGIDTNKNMIELCKSNNLLVEEVDAISYLKSQPSSSLLLITGFHIIEHFKDFDEVLELLQESYRVLKSEGMIIFETPNPRNILVSSSDFWLDPSHNKPIHPLTIKFFAQKLGFVDVKSLIKDHNSFIEIDEIDFNSLDKYISIGRNYSLIGKKL